MDEGRNIEYRREGKFSELQIRELERKRKNLEFGLRPVQYMGNYCYESV